MSLEIKGPNFEVSEYINQGLNNGADGKCVAQIYGTWEAIQAFAQKQSKIHKSMVIVNEPRDISKTYMCYWKGQRLY